MEIESLKSLLQYIKDEGFEIDVLVTDRSSTVRYKELSMRIIGIFILM